MQGIIIFTVGKWLAKVGVNLNWVFDPVHCLRLLAARKSDTERYK